MSVVGAIVAPHPPVILPEIGRGRELAIQNTSEAYREAMRRAALLRPDAVVVLSPHSALCADYFHISPGLSAVGDFSRFGAPEVRVRADYDVVLVKALTRLCAAERLRAGLMGEKSRELDHGTMIPLRFLNEYYGDYRLVRVGLSGLPPLEHYRFGTLIARAAKDTRRRVLIIASGDLSHRLTPDSPSGFAPEGAELDARVTRALREGDFQKLLELPTALREAAAECGVRAFQTMAGAFDGLQVNSEQLSYEGPFGVGYAVFCINPLASDDSRRFGKPCEETCAARPAQRFNKPEIFQI